MFARLFYRRPPSSLATWLRPWQLIPALSVRARIAALAMIPVVGFVANGLNYWVSERQVDQAFEGVRRAGVLTDASRDLKSALDGIRHAAKEMAARPGPAFVKAFNDNHAAALRSLERIQKYGDPDDTRTIPHIMRTVSGLKENFESLTKAEEKVGFSDTQGINGKLREAALKVEQTIKDLSWLAETDAQKLSLSLLAMRRSEVEYKLRRENAPRKEFFAEFDNFNKLFDGVIGADIM
jgi:methyl-accepting chemotaxis protein